jgi:poly-gamma-glutamate capsule biosynthesis protein CapA/YwtB (metallophosphatase superfamily)
MSPPMARVRDAAMARPKPAPPGPLVRAACLRNSRSGVELDTEPRPEQVALGRQFVEAGADVIFGHHAHRIQPIDHNRGRSIFWGLGNFVWPDLSEEGSTTAVAQVVVRPEGRIRGRLLPAYIQEAGHPVLTAG